MAKTHIQQDISNIHDQINFVLISSISKSWFIMRVETFSSRISLVCFQNISTWYQQINLKFDILSKKYWKHDIVSKTLYYE